MVEVRKDARAAGRGAIALVAVQTLTRVLLLAFIIVSAREVGPTEFARYATVAALLVITGFIADFGTTQAVTKAISAGGSSDTVLRRSLSACGLLGVVAYVVGIGLAALVGHSSEAVIDFVLGGFSLPFDGVTTTLCGALDGRGLITQRSVVWLFRIGLGSVFGIVIVLQTNSIRLAMVGLCGGPVIALFVAVWMTWRTRVWSLRAYLNPWWGRTVLRQAIPFALIAGTGAIVARIDVLILSALRSSTETADYNLALRAVEALQYPLWAMLGPTLYLFSKRLSVGDVDGAIRAYRVVAKAFYLIALPLGIGMAVVGREVIRVVFGAPYAGAATPLIILSAGLFITYAQGLGGMFVSAYPQMRRVVIMITVVDAVAVLLQLPFILRWGANGAAVGLMLGQLVTGVVQVIFVRRTLGRWLPAAPPWRLLVATAVCGLVALGVRSTSMLLAVATGAVTYVAVVTLTQGVTREEARSFVSLVRR